MKPVSFQVTPENIRLFFADIIHDLEPGQSVSLQNHDIRRLHGDVEMYEVDGERLTFYEAWQKGTEGVE